MGKEKTYYNNCRRPALAIFSVVLVLVLFSPAYASPLPGASHVWVNLSNDNGAKFETNGSYYLKFDGGGLNALHLTTDSVNNPSGEVTLTDEQSGTFYVTDTGGRGYSDDTILLLAVNGTIPDDFRLHVTASGYNWDPVAIVNTLPEVSDLQYVETTLDEWFTAEDFYYGPQTWKPAGTNLPMAYPVFYGQDTSDTDNNFSLMFIDLNAGPVSKANGLTSASELENSGGVKVDYSFENLETFAAFNAYVWCNQSNQGRGISWTNRVSGDGSSVYEVNGIPSALTAITVSPGAAEVSVDDTYHFTAAAFDQKDRQMAGVNFEWSSDNEEVGTVDDTGLFTAVSEGTVTVTAINGTVDGTTEVTVTAAPSGPEILPDYNHIFIKVANEAGVKYNSYLNNTYNIRFAGPGRGLNAHHITTDPASAPYGQVTATADKSGVFYITDTGGSGFADNVVLMVAANGTIPDDFSINIRTSGYNWTPMEGLEEKPPQSEIRYVKGAVEETFTNKDFRYGMLTWKPSGETTPYPIYEGQNMSNSGDTFQYMFIDTCLGQLGTNSGMEGLTDGGAVKVEYSIENLPDSVVFNSYCWNSNANQGPSVIAWTNNLIGGHNGNSGYSVFKESSEPLEPEILPDYNHIFIKVANEAGVKYNAFENNTYNIRFEGINRGLNALHISTDPAVNFGQVTLSENQSGTFYATDSGGKGYEDEIILMVAVNGTIPEDFRLNILSDGYTWTPNPVSNQPPSPDNVTYRSAALNETFTKDDFRYGPQIWKPTGNECDYPIFGGQNLSDTENTFRIMFIDLNSGVLRPNAGLENQGAVRINYAFENLETFAAFSVYGYCQNSNNGDNMVAWSNALTSDKIMSGYSVMGTDDPALASIEITPSSPVLKTGDALEFSASGYDQYGNEMTGISFAWESLNTTVGTISQTGLFSAKKTGSTVISAKSGEICGETDLVVTPPEITGASIVVPDLKVERGASAMVSVLVSGITGVENISGNISWNPDVISVYSAGVNRSDFADSELSFNLTENNLVFSLTSINGISAESPEPVIDVMFVATGNKNDDSEFTVLNATWSNDSQAGLLSPVCGNITITGLKGDFNENDCVDIGDVSKVAYMVASLTPVDPAADFNGNGEVDLGDAAKIACFFVRGISSL